MRLLKHPLYRTMIMVALPVACQSVLTMLVATADNAMVAAYGNTLGPALGDQMFAGVMMAGAPMNFFSACLFGIASGSTVLISQYWGKGDIPRIRDIFAMVMVMCCALTVTVTALSRCFPEGVLRLFTNQQGVINSGAPYFRIVCLSYLPMGIAGALSGMLRAVEVVRVTLYATLITVASNIFFNWVLIFGNLGFPAMGARGAALGTVIARTLECALVVFYALRVQKRIPLRLRYGTITRASGCRWRWATRNGRWWARLKA